MPEQLIVFAERAITGNGGGNYGDAGCMRHSMNNNFDLCSSTI